MNLFTIVLDFAGGTYIFQIEEKSPYDAMINWIKTFDLKSLKTRNIIKENILKQIYESEERPVLLSGMKNVWCATFFSGKQMALVNIIKTSNK